MLNPMLFYIVDKYSRFPRGALLSLMLLLAAPAQGDEAPFYQPPVIDDIVCEGNEKTDCDFILKKYYQSAGDILDANEVDDARLRLGTLDQFKDINIYLKKGERKGHVVVVIEVHEANQIQYRFGVFALRDESTTTYSESSYGILHGFDKVISTNHTINGLFSVIDYNFFGKGKIFELAAVDQIYIENEVETFYRTPVPNLDFSSGVPIQDQEIEYVSYIKSQSDEFFPSQSLQLRYFDPHLFDSRSYFFDSSIQYRYSDAGYTKSDSIRLSLELGRRFSRYSNISVVHHRTKYDYEANSIFGGVLKETIKGHSTSIYYEWDTTDDLLFPSKGAVFRAGAHGIGRSESRESLDFSLKKHYSVFDRSIITLELGSNIYEATEFDGDKDWKTTTSPTLRFTKKLINNYDEGRFSAWHVGLTYYDRNAAIGTIDHDYKLSVGYTKQTEVMIINFSFDLYTQEGRI